MLQVLGCGPLQSLCCARRKWGVQKTKCLVQGHRVGDRTEKRALFIWLPSLSVWLLGCHLLTLHHGSLLCILVLKGHGLGSVHCLWEILIISEKTQMIGVTTRWTMEESASYSLWIFQHERKLAQKSLAKKRQGDNGELPLVFYSLGDRKGGGSYMKGW